jgi:hypothetical protein
MKRLTLMLLVFFTACFAEKSTIDLNAYKNNKNFSVSEASYTVGSHAFTLVNIKPRVKGDTACISAVIIDKRKFVLFDVGVESGAYGLFVPHIQPIPDGLIALKASTTDGKIFIFLSNGKLVTLPGALAFADTLGKCVYCVWENDKQYRLTVFNYKIMRVVIQTTAIAQPVQWYSSGMSYCFSAPQEKGYYSIDMFTKVVTKIDQAEGALTPVSYLMDFSKIEPVNCCGGKALKK